MSGYKEKAEGAVDKIKGEAKDAYGKMTNNKQKLAEGKVDKAKGAIKDKIGDIKNDRDKK